MIWESLKRILIKILKYQTCLFQNNYDKKIFLKPSIIGFVGFLNENSQLIVPVLRF